MKTTIYFNDIKLKELAVREWIYIGNLRFISPLGEIWDFFTRHVDIYDHNERGNCPFEFWFYSNPGGYAVTQEGDNPIDRV